MDTGGFGVGGFEIWLLWVPPAHYPFRNDQMKYPLATSPKISKVKDCFFTPSASAK